MNTGIAFGDSIRTEKIPQRNYGKNKSRKMRLFPLTILLLFTCSILFVKLVSLQLLQGKFYRTLSDSNRIRTQILHAPRGIIFDRNGVPLVFNSPGFRQVIKGKTTIISWDIALSLMAKGDKNLEIDSFRQYPYKDVLAHVIGYIGQISKEQLKQPEFAGYQLDDLLGQAGIEQQYEHLLRGVDGKQLVEVDAMGRTVRTLGQTDPIPGQNITLTIDIKLQQAVYRAMSSVSHGSAIVSTPTGEVLAMVSKPSFDPNLFTQGVNYKPASNSAYPKLSDVLLDAENHPLLNRAIAGTYPPGSTFKIVAAAAGLEDHVIDTHFTITDPGILKIGSFSFANWYYTDYGRTEQGPLNVVRALVRSNDIFFYKLAEMVTVDRLSEMARKLGLGNTLGIDLSGEAKGLVPTLEWKKKTIGENWYLGDTYHYGIGQGYLLTTPLQVNAWTEVIANDGSLYIPHLLKNKPEKKTANVLSSGTVLAIKQGMIGSCSTGGVAYPLFQFTVKNAKLKINGLDILPVASTSADMRKIQIACKTGTAQHGDENTLAHAWITAFAPADKPEIVVTVLSESSGEGSTIAGPIAKQILEAYFEEK